MTLPITLFSLLYPLKVFCQLCPIDIFNEESGVELRRHLSYHSIEEKWVGDRGDFYFKR
jgi:hypothetical protein